MENTKAQTTKGQGRIAQLTAIVCALAVLSACTPRPVSPERAADICEERAQKAQGVTGEVGIGVNSNSGAFSSLKLGVSSDYLQGRDPQIVYERCVFDKTGQAPIRPANLR